MSKRLQVTLGDHGMGSDKGASVKVDGETIAGVNRIQTSVEAGDSGYVIITLNAKDCDIRQHEDLTGQ